ncbi:MAG: hypothetical protein ACM31L_00790 [Actinomycetota bacterium]
MLPRIPVVAGTPQSLLTLHRDAARALVAEARRRYTAAGVAVADMASRRWLVRTGNPYTAELDALADQLGVAGIHMLNLSYEWGCTTGVGPGPDGTSARLLRTLDWPFDGLGRHLAVLRTRGPAGPYLSLTWPGFAGVLTAMAVGRFSVAINQAKDWHGRLTRMLEWPLNRICMAASAALPPAHLLRRVCDEAADFDAAVRMLSEVPVCLPVFFSVAGVRPDQACVIERMPSAARLHPGPTACANHWRFPGLKGERPSAARHLDFASAYMRASHARYGAMLRLQAAADEGFSWLVPPVLCPDTRLACVADAVHGRLAAVGIERMARATETLVVTA